MIFEFFVAQKISSEQSNKVQLQLVLHNDSSIKFQFLGETSTKDRNKVTITSLLVQSLKFYETGERLSIEGFEQVEAV